VLVVGSANVDVSVTTPALPRPGETVVGDGSMISVGGKGANQAVAAARCGADVDFVARVGDDAFGRMVVDSLAAAGVATAEVRPVAGVGTGLAAIYVDHAGQNCIVVVPGANARLAADELEALAPAVAAAAVVVVQCEVPLPTVYRLAALARRAGTPLVLNPAPAHGLELARLAGPATYLVPNETEAAALAGQPATTRAEAIDCARRLVTAGGSCVIVTLGAAGCVAVDAAGAEHFPAPRVEAIDTTGAGDAFVGCFAAALAAGRPRAEAIRRAIVYAALSTTRRGAQASYAAREEYERAWAAAAPASG
jgi:ribokinase